MKQKVKVDAAEMKALSDVIPVNVLLDTKKLTTYAKEHNDAIRGFRALIHKHLNNLREP